MLPLTIELKPSYYLTGILLVIHIAALGVLSLASLANSIKIAAIIVILLSLAYQLRRYAWLMHAKSIRTLGCDSAGAWYKVSVGDNQQKSVCLVSAYLCSWLVIVAVKAQTRSRRYTAVLLKDSCGIEDWQQLRVILRSGAKIS